MAYLVNHINANRFILHYKVINYISISSNKVNINNLEIYS